MTEDFVLLASCQHVIMSVGSFGYWAAFLAGGDVVYYKDHYVKGSWKSKGYRDRFQFPPEWIAIS